MSSVIFLSNKLKESWEKNVMDKKTNEISTNSNLLALRKVRINTIEDYCKLLIEEMNKINSKYMISDVEFVDIPVPGNSKSALNAGRIAKKIDNEYYTEAYIFISNPYLGSRNIFGSQQIFPGLSYLIKNYINSPSYELANHPIYFINGSTDSITESMIKTLVSIELMGIRYVQLFKSKKEIIKKPKNDLVWYSNFISNNENGDKDNNGVIKTDYYEIDYINREISFSTKTFKEDDISKFGSSDRFFVVKSYPALILADQDK